MNRLQITPTEGKKHVTPLSLLKSYAFHYCSALTQDMDSLAKKYCLQCDSLVASLEPYLGPIKGKTILDAGCGFSFPYSSLLASRGNSVVGIDAAYVSAEKISPSRCIKELKYNGFTWLMRTLVFAVLGKDKRFSEALRKLGTSGQNVTKGSPTLIRMNIEKMDFPDDTFDIVISMAVFEHIRDLRKAVSEIHRVLKKGGVAYVLIHLFTSLSGGHHNAYMSPKKVPPWDHLRSQTCPVPVYLNRAREEEYVLAFSERFSILETNRTYEDESVEALLTPEILGELSCYSKSELLTRAICIIAKKAG